MKKDLCLSRNKYVLDGALWTNYADPSSAPLIYSWAAGNTAGETKKKVINGILLIGQCAGNVCSRRTDATPQMLIHDQVVGPNLYTTEEAPGYRRGLLSK